jgi:hypothetical protein
MPTLQATLSTSGGTPGREARHGRGRLPEPVRTTLDARTDIGGIDGKFGMDRRTQGQGQKVGSQKPILRTYHLTPRRAPAPFLKAEAIQNLGKHAVGFGKAFERRVRALFDKGLTDAAIARALDAGRATVTYRTMHWRKRKQVK